MTTSISPSSPSDPTATSTSATASTASTAAPTLIRIKRKRTDEPLDALVVEDRSRRKKSRGTSGFFQFAETVESEKFWEDEVVTKVLNDRISSLANQGITPANKPANGAQASIARRYTVVQKPTETRPATHTSELQKEPPAATNDYTLYEAILEASSHADEPIDPEMEKFLPLLKEYLRMNDEPANIANTSSSSENHDEYVWDVFYHRPAIADWAAAASNIATISGLPSVGDEGSDSDSDPTGDTDDEDSNTEDFYRNDYPDEDPDESDDSHHLSDYDRDYISDEDSEIDNRMSWRRRT